MNVFRAGTNPRLLKRDGFVLPVNDSSLQPCRRSGSLRIMCISSIPARTLLADRNDLKFSIGRSDAFDGPMVLRHEIFQVFDLPREVACHLAHSFGSLP